MVYIENCAFRSIKEFEIAAIYCKSLSNISTDVYSLLLQWSLFSLTLFNWSFHNDNNIALWRNDTKTVTCHSINNISKFTYPNHSDQEHLLSIFYSKQNSQITTKLTLITSLWPNNGSHNLQFLWQKLTTFIY